jgi:hypothetical protein
MILATRWGLVTINATMPTVLAEWRLLRKRLPKLSGWKELTWAQINAKIREIAPFRACSLLCLC